jgi:hypothetical protein
MSAETVVGTAYPAPVAVLLPRARRLAAELGELPSRNRLMTELRIGAAKANALHLADGRVPHRPAAAVRRDPHRPGAARPGSRPASVPAAGRGRARARGSPENLTVDLPQPSVDGRIRPDRAG